MTPKLTEKDCAYRATFFTRGLDMSPRLVQKVGPRMLAESVMGARTVNRLSALQAARLKTPGSACHRWRTLLVY